MRYYQIDITDATSGAVKRSFSSFVSGRTLAGALDIELDMFVNPFAVPSGGSLVRIWGIALQDISNASNFNGMGITVYGGMQKGLPLANPQQSGVLFQGFILQAFGNWIDTDMTLDFIVAAGVSPTGTPKNLTFNWQKGTNLGDAIRQTLTTAFPDYTVNVNISPNLVVNDTKTGFYSNVVQLAQMIKDLSASIIGGSYVGVDILLTKTTFNVYDGTTQASPKQLEFKDLIGQPTWIEAGQIQFKTVMRADLTVSDIVKMPDAIFTTTQQAQSAFIKTKSAFQGSFQIQTVHHLGKFRQADAASWVTVFEAAATVIQQAA